MTTQELFALARGMKDRRSQAAVLDALRRPTPKEGSAAKSAKKTSPRGPNGLERAYADHLEQRRLAGEIVWWAFEPLSIRLARLAQGASYKPDFAVMLPSGEIEFHETKGFWREAARVRIKVAADKIPCKFICIKRIANEFVHETIPGAWHTQKKS